jgi:hypothetical protein
MSHRVTELSTQIAPQVEYDPMEKSEQVPFHELEVESTDATIEIEIESSDLQEVVSNPTEPVLVNHSRMIK